MISINYEDIANIKDFVRTFIEQTPAMNYHIRTSAAEIVLENLRKSFKYIEASGGVVRNERDEILLIYRHNKWDLPKGKRNKTESIEECAVREVEEECGICNVSIGKPLKPSFHLYMFNDNVILKKTYWFEMLYTGTEYGSPQLEEGIEQILWKPKTTLSDLFALSFPSVVKVLQSI